MVAGHSYLSKRTIRCQGRWKLLSSILVSVPNTHKFEFVLLIAFLSCTKYEKKSMHHNHTLRNEFEASVWWFTNKNKKKRKSERKLFPVQHLPWSQMESKISTLWRFGSSWSAFFQIICMSRTSECRVHAAALNLNVMKFKYHPEFLLASLWRGGTRDDCNSDDNIKKNVL